MPSNFKCIGGIYLNSIPQEYAVNSSICVDFSTIEQQNRKECSKCASKIPCYIDGYFRTVCTFSKEHELKPSIDIFKNNFEDDFKNITERTQTNIDSFSTNTNATDSTGELIVHKCDSEQFESTEPVRVNIHDVITKNDAVNQTSNQSNPVHIRMDGMPEVISGMDYDGDDITDIPEYSNWTLFEDCALEEVLNGKTNVGIPQAIERIDEMFGTPKGYHSNYRNRKEELELNLAKCNVPGTIIDFKFNEYKPIVYSILSREDISDIVHIAFKYGRIDFNTIAEIVKKYPVLIKHKIPVSVIAKLIRVEIHSDYLELRHNYDMTRVHIIKRKPEIESNDGSRIGINIDISNWDTEALTKSICDALSTDYAKTMSLTEIHRAVGKKYSKNVVKYNLERMDKEGIVKFNTYKSGSCIAKLV